jgi:predicted glycosyltransferase/peptidoglycan/xylan/chitin deacetylase (PgdA/CDA1 family)
VSPAEPRTILLVVTHLLGVGHLARAAALGRGFARAGHRVVLATGGRPVPTVSTAGLRVIQLPPVHCRGVDFSTLLGDDGAPIGPGLRQARSALLLEAVAAEDPDVVITETYPFGRRQLADEFGAVVMAARQGRPGRLILASIRDILNPPSKPSKVPAANEILARGFDGVLVHGDEAVAPLAASWPDGNGLARILAYTGYITDDALAPSAGGARCEEILVSGGGSDASLPLFESALGAATLLSRPWRILVGHGVGEDALAALRRAAPGHVTVERARADFPALLAAAAVSVSQAGYNTVVDLVRARTRAVLVPFERGREAEQRLRAECFSARGLARVVREQDLGPETLAAAVREALASDPPAASIDLQGVAGSLRAMTASWARSRAVAAGWAALDAALEEATAHGRAVTVWWRDDDAVDATPELDRLLALSARLGVPLALAVIPAGAGPRLARRLGGEPLVEVLVHGYAHLNHAPPGAKKQELGFRPLRLVAAELSGARARLNDLFGPGCLPVLVPPWNRIDPALVPLLPGLGFSGLSTFGRPAAAAPAGLTVANAHLDPIDWKRGGGLADEAEILSRLASDIRATAAGALGPVGILTHHRVHDAWVWAFVERLLERLAARPGIEFLAARNVFASTSVSKDYVERDTASA